MNVIPIFVSAWLLCHPQLVPLHPIIEELRRMDEWQLKMELKGIQQGEAIYEEGEQLRIMLLDICAEQKRFDALDASQAQLKQMIEEAKKRYQQFRRRDSSYYQHLNRLATPRK